MADILIALGLTSLGFLLGSFASFTAGWKKAEERTDNGWQDKVAAMVRDLGEDAAMLESNLEKLRAHLDAARERMIK